MLLFVVVSMLISCHSQRIKGNKADTAINQEMVDSVLGTWYITETSVDMTPSKRMIRLNEDAILFEQEEYHVVRTDHYAIYGKKRGGPQKRIRFELIGGELIVTQAEEKKVLVRPYSNYVNVGYGTDLRGNERYAKELEKMHILFEHHEPFQVSLISYTSEGAKIIETIEYDKEKIDYLKDMTADESQNKGIVTDRFDRMDYVEYVDNEGNDMEEYVLSKGDGLAHQEKVVFPLTD